MEASEETNRQSSEEGSSTSETPAASVSVAPAPVPPPAAPASPAKKVTSTVKKLNLKRILNESRLEKDSLNSTGKRVTERGLRIMPLQ